MISLWPFAPQPADINLIDKNEIELSLRVTRKKEDMIQFFGIQNNLNFMHRVFRIFANCHCIDLKI